MRTVARRVALSLSEAKRFTILAEAFSPTFVGVTTYRWNVRSVFGPVPQANSANGAPSWARIGSEIVDPMLKLKFYFGINWANLMSTTPLAYGTIHMVVMLVAASEELVGSNSVINYDTSSTDPGWFLQPQPKTVTMNGNNIRVLKRWRKKITPDQISTAAPVGATYTYLGQGQITGQLTYRWKGKKTYQDLVGVSPNPTSDVFLRGVQYYILTGWETTYPIASAARPLLTVDSFMYFKDP